MFDAEVIARHPSAGPDAPVPLRWPPPGLEAMQGAAWSLITTLAPGAFLAVVPLLLSVVMPQTFWSTGVFGASWWFPVSTAMLGVLMVLFALAQLVSMLFAGSKAVRQGHDWATVAYVVCDGRRDSGFLMQGARQYASLPERERRWLLASRILATLSYLLALLWLPIGLCAGVVLAGRGHIAHPGTVLTLVLAPAAGILLVGIGCRLLESFSRRQLLRQWHRDADGDMRLRHEIEEWRSARAELLEAAPVSSHRTRLAHAAALVLFVIAVLLPLPLITIAVATAIGPVVAQFSVPRFDASAARIAKAALLAPYAVTPDPSITPLEAGELLHAVSVVSRTSTQGALERQPVRRFVAWPKDDAPATLPPPERYGELFPRARSLSAAELAFLERTARHPAHADFSRLARAAVADIPAGRWNMDLLASASMFELPIPAFGGLRSAAHYHVARAVLESARGDRTAAETTLREIISVGVLLAREGPTILDMLTGNTIATTGGTALESFYRSVGRTAEADELRRLVDGVDRMDQVTRALRTAGDTDGELRRAMALTSNEELPRGMRWESLMTLQISAGCLNPHTAVFGRGDEYTTWVEGTRAALVRYPSEAALFDLVLRGPVPSDMQQRAGLLERVLRVTLGRDDVAGRCASLLTGMRN